MLILPVYILDLTCEDDEGRQYVRAYMSAIAPPVEAIIDQPTSAKDTYLGRELSLSGSAQGGTPPYSYEWDSDEQGPLGAGASITASLGIKSLEGEELFHAVSLTVTDSMGFTNRSYVDVTVHEYPDLDRDDDIDQSDFGLFQRCLAGPDTPYQEGCGPSDIDGDDDVDQDDVELFSGCLSGPAVPAEPGCAGSP